MVSSAGGDRCFPGQAACGAAAGVRSASDEGPGPCSWGRGEKSIVAPRPGTGFCARSLDIGVIANESDRSGCHGSGLKHRLCTS